MNRRRTMTRRGGLLRRLGRPRNRRLRPRPAAGAAAAPRDWRSLLHRIGRLGLSTLKLCGLLLVLGAVGLGSYHGYRRAMASTTFKVKQIAVEGTRRAPRQEIVHLVHSLLGRSIFGVDLSSVSRAVEGHPWVKRARARRELPDRILIEVDEHRPEALLHLGYLYLVNADGEVFKRASLEESDGLPVITGIERGEHLASPEACRLRVKRALEALQRYQAQPRPALSEVNLGPRDEITLYLRQGGLAVRLGNQASPERLSRFDAVWTALGPEVRRARAIFLDHEIRTDRVVVRMGSSE